MFRRILIANRGEVAVRIANAARSLGCEPIGIASEADIDSSWAKAMAETVCVGPAASKQSYLHRERVLQAALQTHCTALHPGWGFLAEDPSFAALCEQHGITFIGPSPGVMQRMALKSPAKAAMRASGLAVIPGSDGPLKDVDAALACAEEVGYPVICKADAGGGGRGMRLCHNKEELKTAWPQAVMESEAAFGNGSLYLERYLTGGRHIEVQLLCDRYGHAIHLGERECSVQRNHQKLLEESPSPVLDDETRSQIGLGAARAAAAIGYVGAGTIEFLRHKDGTLYFMEMNTRLQVEHPVTEMVTGLDIAAWQIRIAAGQPLTVQQEDVQFKGAAIECRINAEDPRRDFRPTPGQLERFDIPLEVGPGQIRMDTHLQTGERVVPYYDSLIGKLIAFGSDRKEAIATMEAALKQASIQGVSTTAELHLCVLGDEQFRSGNYDTQSIPGWPPVGN